MLEPLKIPCSKFLPEIMFNINDGIFKIEGKSIPEDSSAFYAPIEKWLKKYFDGTPKEQTKLILKLGYYNSSSARSIANIIKIFDDEYKKGNDVNVTWLYNPEDEAMRENGEDFCIIFSLPIKIISINK